VSLFDELVEALRILPGVGPKSAQRMAFSLLQRDREQGLAMAKTISTAMTEIGRCESCRNYCEGSACELCNDPRRNDTMLCVVEYPADIIAIESAGGFRGRYFVLHGHLSPIDGIGPGDLGLADLELQIKMQKFDEVILATNPTVEGEATAHYISQLLKPHVQVISRIAHGVPLGSELEYIDGGTIVHALQGRKSLT